MLRIENLKLSPGGGSSALRNAVLHILRIPEKDLLALHILRRSIDAREVTIRFIRCIFKYPGI